MPRTTAMPTFRTFVGAVCLTVIAAAGAQAQSHNGHAGHPAPATAGASESTKAFEAVNAKMHADMTIKFTGNADVDFVRGMIPHHQGAIDMAEVVLKHGKDAAVRRLARNIIREQKKEIAWMNAWLKKNEK